MSVSKITAVLLACCVDISKAEQAKKTLSAQVENIATAIYYAEGKDSKYPYGVKVPTLNGEFYKFSDISARRICIKTINTAIDNWVYSGMKGDFIDFLADRYCPPYVDPQGNKNWKKNVKFYLNKWSKK